MKMNDSIASAQAPVMGRRLFLNIGTAATAASLLAACGGGDGTNHNTQVSAAADTATPVDTTTPTVPTTPITIEPTPTPAPTPTPDPAPAPAPAPAPTPAPAPSPAPNAPDTLAPTITLNGANPMTLTIGTAYAEPGANWTDNKDGSGVVTTISGAVGATVGSYTITYTRSDAAGNIGTATRTVNVVAAGDPAPIAGGAFVALADMTVSDNLGNTPISINAGGVTDTLGRTIVYSVSGLPNDANGTLTINTSTGVISGVYDALGGTLSLTPFTVTVTATPTGGAHPISKTWILSIRNDG